MIGYSDMSTKPQRSCLPGVWTLVLALLLFAVTLTGFALLEAGRAQSAEDQRLGNVFIVSRLWSHFRAPTNESEHELAATVERVARAATNASRSSNYYEEQQAVVVNAESAPPARAARQYSLDSDDVSYADNDYGSQQSAEESYVASDSGSESQEQSSAGEGRSAQAHAYDSYYGQWKYATQTAAPPSGNNRKMQPAANRSPYAAYDDDVYDYPMGFQPRPHEQVVSKQVAPAPANAVVPAPVATESTIVTFLKALKQLWDLYQALTSAWGTVAERHQQSTAQLRKERLEKQRLRQQQQQQQIKNRLNSKKPQRIEGDKMAKLNQTKKTKATTTTTTTTTSTTSSSDSDSSEEATASPAAAENGKIATEGSGQAIAARGLRNKRAVEPASSDVGEGRYIKGDPLKGYYDFVITEGSYKFWAVFQVGTALLIIYSTFAAIYYSKVNPLTSDYDYQDYLGAGRSMTGGDDDFVDDSEPSTPASPTSRIMNWLPRTAHSLQFILDAIDKIPLDHDQKPEAGWPTGNRDAAASDDATGTDT